MKKVTSTVSYNVPNWNFCNVDRIDIDGSLSKDTCKFCSKDKQGAYCTLHNTGLATTNGLISKAAACCKNPSTVESTEIVVKPKEIMKQTIDLYTTTVRSLQNQGYPANMAENIAKKYIMGD